MLLIDKSSDVYNLYDMIEAGDTVRATSSRKVELESGKQVRVTLQLEVCVEKVDVDLQGSALYVKGKVTNENEHVKVGSYHTIDLGLDTKFRLA